MLWNTLVRRIGGRVANQAISEYRKPGNLLDLRLGISLLRDRRVPPAAKLLALGVGIALTWALQACELPLEFVMATLLPGLGMAASVAIDGSEMLACPLLFAALAMPYLAPKPVTAEARTTRRDASGTSRNDVYHRRIASKDR